MEPMIPSRCQETATTLYDLISAIQEELTPEEREAGVATTVVRNLLRRGVLRPSSWRERGHNPTGRVDTLWEVGAAVAATGL